MTVRPALAADVPAIAAVLAANDEAMDWPDLPGLGWPYLDHLVQRARVFVADGEDRLAGVGASVGVGDEGVRFLTDLFVDPAQQSRGTGSELLAAALEGATQRMTFSSGDPRALSLYIRAGMRPWWPLLYVEADADRLGDHDALVEVVAADVAETVAWSRAWTGVDRSLDFAHYGSLPEAHGFVIHDAGAVAAVGWARRERRRSDGRWLDHASIAPDADPVRAALAVLRVTAAGGRSIAPIPGPHPVMPQLLERGARIRGRDTLCASEPGLLDPERTLPNPGFV
jgi:GNAT superfamily N-acetyltransferase